MTQQNLSKYLSNCLWLIVPIMLWNVFLQSRLPAPYEMHNFWKDIPALLGNSENVARMIIFFLPALMPLRIRVPSQRVGLWLYLAGSAIYFLSWTAQILWPQSAWSTSAIGFLAPAYTAILWLVGIGLLGNQLYFKSPYRSWVYISLTVLFGIFHVSHAWIVYARSF